MKVLYFLLCTLFLCFLGGDTDVPDNSGKEFIIAFMDNAFENPVSLNLFLTTNYPSPIQVLISAHPAYIHHLPVLNRTVNVSRGLITQVEIPNDFVMKNTNKEFKGVHLSADEEFILYGSNAESYSLDAFVALPVDILGQEYIAGSYEFCRLHFALIGLIGVNNDTDIEITPAPGMNIIVMGRTVSSKTVISLNRLETIQIQSTSDVTGTRINSSKPLAVVSGNQCTNIPCGVTACDHVVEQLYPVDRWGYTFTVVPSAYRQSGDIVRVVGSTDDTAVDITGISRLMLNSSEFYEFKVLKDAPVFVNASKPIMVLQFTQSQNTDGLESDPYMMVVPAIEQFSSSYTIVTANLPDKVYQNFVNIVIKNSSKDDLRVDGAALNDVTWLAIPGTDLTAVQLNVTAGTHRIEHISPIQTFSVFSYGFARYVSYGYPGGLRLANLDVTKCVPNTGQPADGVDNDCDMKIDEELFNGIDDDEDGVIDEDLSSLPPEVDFPRDTVIVSGYNASVANSFTIVADTPNATGSERCVAYRDITINFTDSINDNGCGVDIQRTWFVQDGCGNVVRSIQNVSVYSSWKAFRADPSSNCTTVMQRVDCNDSTEVSEIGQCAYSPCSENESQFALFDGYKCNCDLSGGGAKCMKDWCADNTFINKGVCVINETTYQCVQCTCPVGLHGKHCEQINWCADDSCQNGGVCINNGTSYWCICPPGFHGKHCYYDWCAGDPCQNGGVCITNETTYQCICPPGFHGRHCDQINWCAADPCHNGAVCINNETTYQCICPPGFHGRHCDLINWCAGDPCLNGSVCINNETTYQCICPPGFHGRHCDEINWCAENPCLSGGVCINNETTYQCICPTGFHGRHCDQINWCSCNPCYNGGVCVNNEMSYHCICPPGFFGIHCDQIIKNLTTAQSNARAAAQETSRITTLVPSVTATGVVLVCVVCITAALWNRYLKKRKTNPDPNDNPMDQKEQADVEDDEETACSSSTEIVNAVPPALVLFPGTVSSGSKRLYNGGHRGRHGKLNLIYPEQFLNQEEKADIEDDEESQYSSPTEAVNAYPPALVLFPGTVSSGSKRLYTGDHKGRLGELKSINPEQPLDQEEQASVEDDEEPSCSSPTEVVISNPPPLVMFPGTVGSGSKGLYKGDRKGRHGELKSILPRQPGPDNGHTSAVQSFSPQPLPRRLPPLQT